MCLSHFSLRITPSHPQAAINENRRKVSSGEVQHGRSSDPPLSSSVGEQLPEFPTLKDMRPPLSHAFPPMVAANNGYEAAAIPWDKVQTLLTMYRAHCQRVMDSVNKFSFSEVILNLCIGQ